MPICELTGEEVPADSEAWRHDCEVRWILDGIPDLHARRDHVNGTTDYKGNVIKKGIRQIRGDAAAERIIEDLRRLHALRMERWRAANEAKTA
jgi:hypothetical protein